MRDEPLSAIDHAWLRMDRPTNRMMITALLELEGRLSMAALAETIRDRLLPHVRFRQRIVRPFIGRPRWSLDPEFTLSAHLHRIGLPPPGDERALAELAGDLASQPLDRDRPLWQVHLVEQYGAGSAIVVRLHHCIADGIALVRLLLSLTDHVPEAAAPEVGLRPPPPVGPIGRLRRAAEQAATVARILLLSPDPPTVLRGALGVRKRVSFSAPAPLEAIRGAARATGSTVHDVLLAAVSGALRSHLELPAGVEVRALVPVNLRDVVGGGEAGNRFGLVFVPLPLGGATAAERLTEVRARMAAIKSSPEALVAFGVLAAMGLARATVERFGVDLFTNKASVMVTSIPGPARPVRLAGQTVRSLSVWAPAAGGMSLTMSLLSYRGEVRLGVAADERRVPDPEAIADAFDHELRELVQRPGARGVT